MERCFKLMNENIDEIIAKDEMLSAYKDEMQPGTYELNTSMTTEEMMEIMAMQVEEE